MVPLDPATSTRLVKLLGMLESDHPGEVANAGSAAHRLLQRAGLTWAEIIAPSPPAQTRPSWPEPGDWRQAVRACLDLPDAPLTDWDRSFLRSILSWDVLTEKQNAKLDSIIEKCRSFATRAA